MRDSSRLPVWFSAAIVAASCSSLFSCSDAPATQAISLPESGMENPTPMGEPSSPAAPVDAEPMAPSDVPEGSSEAPVAVDAPLDNSGTPAIPVDPGTTGAPVDPGTTDTPVDPGTTDTPTTPEVPPNLPTAVVPPVVVDCSQAGTAPISVAWDAVDSQQPDWFGTPEALSMAENVLYYRDGDRGWPKAIDMATREAPLGGQSTIDNDATTTELDFLARVYSATGCAKYGDAVKSGIDYLFEAQYDNGGWPQYYPNADFYRPHITYNDNAMVHVLQLLRQVSRRASPYPLPMTR